MSSAKTFVSIQSHTKEKPSTFTFNGIQCSVDYVKRHNAVRLELRCVEMKPGAGFGGGTAVAFPMMFGIEKEITLEDGWKRANAKKEDAIREKVLTAIQDRTGDYWKHVETFATENGLTILPPETATAAAAG